MCNLLVRPVADQWFMKDEEVATLQTQVRAAGALSPGTTMPGSAGIGAWRLNLVSLLAWLAVGIPLAWGIWITLSNALVLFG
jgi:hypothetical protein